MTNIEDKLFNPIKSSLELNKRTVMPTKAVKGNSGDIIIDSGSETATFPYNVRMITSENDITLHIMPIHNDDEIYVPIYIEAETLQKVPEFRLLNTTDSTGYNSSTITYWM